MVLNLFFFMTFFIAFLLPNHYYPWGSFYLEFAAFIALFSALLKVASRSGSVVVPRISIMFFFVSLLPILQVATGKIDFFGDAVTVFFYLSSFVLCLIVSNFIVGEEINSKTVDSVALSFLVIGIISVWLALIQSLQLFSSPLIHNLPLHARPYANLGQPNNYSTLIWLAVFSLYYLYEKKCIGRAGGLICGFFLVGGAALAQSRTSYVLLFVLLFVALGHCAIFRSWKAGRLRFVALAGLAYFISGWAWPHINNFLFFDGVKSTRLHLTDIRIDMWSSFWTAILEKPWFGYGFGQVSHAQVAVAESYPAVGMTQYTHNLFLDLLVWAGIPLGLLIFCLISLFWIKIFLVSDSKKGFYSISAFSSILVHSLLEYPHAYSYFLLIAGFFIGLSLFDVINPDRISNLLRPLINRFLKTWGHLEKSVNVPQWVLGMCILIYGSFLTLAWIDYRVLEEDHRLLRFEAASIGTLRADKKAPDVFLFDQLRAFTWVARTHEFVNLEEGEAELIENIALRYPLPMPIYKLAQLRVQQGRIEDAYRELLLIKHLHGDEIYETSRANLANWMDKKAEQ
ncbi:PglL family O-oligosaccharyltransferase [Marinobacter sp. ELB17]|uniref:PglL family O-oligosaccharyltransferase n=1 Tax=Marinobacter sp. ELB17 TaxID=270374 RepID=UPI0000F38F59|nr:O-antigen ligase family protein [Marinobacter sp. ELB17]EBA01122.1 O-antigen polymerase [Marinobacter sp. ELB17]